MTMQLKGKILQVFPTATGSGKKGLWERQDFLLETPAQYPKKIFISLWGQANIDKYDLEPGLEITAHLELESREYNNKWYTEARAWKIEWTAQARRWQPGAPG